MKKFLLSSSLILVASLTMQNNAMQNQTQKYNRVTLLFKSDGDRFQFLANAFSHAKIIDSECMLSEKNGVEYPAIELSIDNLTSSETYLILSAISSKSPKTSAIKPFGTEFKVVK